MRTTGVGLAFATLCFSLVGPLLAEPLSRPAGLEPDIAFWRNVFTEVTTEQALIHDNRRLDVIYETVSVPAGTSRSRQRRISERARTKYKEILNTLASGKRQGLTSEQTRVLALWPDDVSNDELRAATRRVRFQQGLADRFHEGLIRSGQWRDHIRQSLRREGVPESLAALPHVESSYNPAARSHVGAAGLWQFTRSTGRRFMQIDHVVDERRDPYLSSDAAARLLQYNYSILKSWPLAITAYNHGVAGMRRAVKSTGTDDIETIVRNYSGRAFGFASRNFYVAFLAAVEAERNAEKYFGPVKRVSPRPEMVVALPDYIPVATLEDVFGVSRQTLQAYNPALMSTVWSGTKHVPRGFELRLPEDSADRPASQILTAIPADQRFTEQTPDLYHKVERGDTLSVIAARYRTSVSELVAMNGLKSRHRIRAGQVLRLPYSGPMPSQPIPDGASTYVVRRGDTVGSIADRAGISERELLALNAIPNRNRIYPGQELIIQRERPDAVPAESIQVAQAPGPGAGIPANVVQGAQTPESAAQVADANPQAGPAPGARAPAEPEPVTVARVDSEPAAQPPVEAEPAPSMPANPEPAALARVDLEPAARALAEPEPAALARVELEPAASALAELGPAPLADGGLSVEEVDTVAVADAADMDDEAVLLADPSDYLVAADGTIEVQAAETLGHYADWLNLRTQRLRNINGYAFRQPVMIGRRLTLDFRKVDAESFTQRRIAHHQELQEAFFTRYRIADTGLHRLRRGESVWVLSQRRYNVPVWLLRQYNPELDLDHVRPGMEIVIPQIERVASGADKRDALADAS